MTRLRVLCLHGMGANSRIFKEQFCKLTIIPIPKILENNVSPEPTAPVRSLLSSEYIFTFLDGLETCTPPSEISDFYAGPYLCWYKSPCAHKVAQAHKRILAFMRSEGPFDVILGFSQGASIAASLLVHHQLDNPPSTPPLFRAAIFICSPLPFSRCLSYGYNTRGYFGLRATIKGVESRPAKVPDYLIPQDNEYFDYFLKPEIGHWPESDSSTEEDDDDYDNQDRFCSTVHKGCRKLGVTLYYQMFHASVDDVQIPIPTAHIYGRSDPWRPHSVDLIGLCDIGKVRTYQHDGGHEIPRDESEEICDTIESTLSTL
ncbi:serine hydrolase FSH [Lasiosphaeris hirsuta]|uniref:Serine hydrolase FSH n=1 Tax=Lasiosphaeris hirsuta TaxID=260670 RepID=A0AA39ZRQ6_9PEZI|nr:serine hydrolase FSH [Lasiosphaeris hirsuta]